LKSTVERRFYDLGRIGYVGQKNVDFGFDASKVLSPEALQVLQQKRDASVAQKKAPVAPASILACGGGPSTHAGAEVPVDEFFDPRGFARQQAQARYQSTQKHTISEGDLGPPPPPAPPNNA
jgi:hypothetical protein